MSCKPVSFELPPDKMPEAEVSLRLAFALIASETTDMPIEVAIDGAQVQINDSIHFDIRSFLEVEGFQGTGGEHSWRTSYQGMSGGKSGVLKVHSKSGTGDVIAQLRDGRVFRAESKKGPLGKSASSAQYPLIRQALGQLLTIEVVDENDLLVVAVPYSEKFCELAERWNRAPLVRRARIRILTVHRCGHVNNLQELLSPGAKFVTDRDPAHRRGGTP